MATFSKFLKSIYRDGNDGKQFETFVKWFLTNSPEWSTQVDKVWLWDDFPKRWGKDKGIDLVFLDKNAEYWAVQAKCYAADYYVTKADIDRFLSESNRKIISQRLLVATTDRLGANAREVCAGQEKPIVRYMLSNFEHAKLDYPDDYKDLRKLKKRDKPSAKPHQDAAIMDVVKGFKEADRGQLIMACGTGKTFTTLWIKEKMKSRNTLVLLPSLNLLAQTVSEWSFASKLKIDVLCVCSDKSVGKKKDDDVVQSLSDVPFPVHSDTKIIKKFLKRAGDKVIFSTYQSSELVAAAQKGRVPPFDLIIADEAHRCATSGKKDSAFRIVLDEKRIKADKRLFATATPRTYTTRVEKAAKERGVDVDGMDDETKFGKRFHTLTFGEAIGNEPPLLTDYQVVIVGVDNSMVAEWIESRELVSTEDGETVTDAESLAAQIGLLKAMKDFNLKRVISFHSRVKRAEEFSQDIHGAARIVAKRHLPKGTIKADFVSGAMPTADREEKLKTLKNVGRNEIGLLSNARCLSEGVDVPSLDGVAFIDPKNSQVEIIQAVGRAIRLSKDKAIGTIVLPVFVQDGEDTEERIEKSNFQPIWWVLNALKAHDKVLVDELDALRTDMGKRGSLAARSWTIPKIVIDLPITVGDQFATTLKTRLVEQTTDSWDFWFGLLAAYASENAHTNVPKNFVTENGHRLGIWVNTQRSKRRLLTDERRKKLEVQPGWVWHAKNAQWEKAFGHLQQFVEEFGHARVPLDYKLNSEFRLGSWVVNQRSRRSVLGPEQEQRLEALPGWSWDTNDAAWEAAFTHLQDFVTEFGHARVPYSYQLKSGFKLGSWIANQRTSNKRTTRSSLTPERKQRLEAQPGWVWTIKEADWEEGFLCLQGFVEKGKAKPHKNMLTPPEYVGAVNALGTLEGLRLAADTPPRDKIDEHGVGHKFSDQLKRFPLIKAALGPEVISRIGNKK